MLRNYIKLAIRNIQNHTSYSFINLSGLSIGLAAAIIISLYAINILSYNKNHADKDRIFLAYKERVTPTGVQPTYDTWIPMADRLKSTYTQVEEAAMTNFSSCMVIKDKEYLEEDILYSEESLFDIFTFKFRNQADNYFQGQNSVVISESIAAKYFAKENAIGQELEIFLRQEDTTMRFTVSGVFEDQPENSFFRVPIIIQIEAIPGFDEYTNNWGSSFLETWVKLDKKENRAILEAQFPELVESIWDSEVASRTNFKLLPMQDLYDTLVGDSNDAWIMIYIALGIMIIASINFMNLATARSSYRSREIGLRKVLGAIIPQIRTQFLVEAVLYTFIALVAGLIIVFFTIPYINTLFGLSLDFNDLISFQGLIALLAIAILIGIVSGSYPAFYLSTISIMQVLRKTGITGGAKSFRNALIVIQFGLAVLLICGALLIRNQLMFMYERDMGFEGDQLLFINASPSDFTDTEIGATRINSFKKNIANYPFVERVTASRHIPTEWSRSFTFVRTPGWSGDPLRMRYTYVDANFFDTYGIELVQGRNFLPDLEGHQRESVILNQAAFEALNLDTAVNPALAFGERRISVVGVAKDFNFETLRNEIEPTLHFHRTADHPVHNHLTVKIQEGTGVSFLTTLEDEWNSLDAINPFRYAFADQSIQSMYETETQFLGLMSFFTAISIIIACLGLYGLTVFVIEKKRKEISIRKVVGADIKEITQLIIMDFAPWVGLAIVIGGIASVLFFNSWVESFFYQAPIDYSIFILSAVLVILLVGVTVSFHTVNAALANPVKYLREE